MPLYNSYIRSHCWKLSRLSVNICCFVGACLERLLLLLSRDDTLTFCHLEQGAIKRDVHGVTPLLDSITTEVYVESHNHTFKDSRRFFLHDMFHRNYVADGITRNRSAMTNIEGPQDTKRSFSMEDKMLVPDNKISQRLSDEERDMTLIVWFRCAYYRSCQECHTWLHAKSLSAVGKEEEAEFKAFRLYTATEIEFLTRTQEIISSDGVRGQRCLLFVFNFRGKWK